jgi:hypothetical protein
MNGRIFNILDYSNFYQEISLLIQVISRYIFTSNFPFVFGKEKNEYQKTAKINKFRYKHFTVCLIVFVTDTRLLVCLYLVDEQFNTVI